MIVLYLDLHMAWMLVMVKIGNQHRFLYHSFWENLLQHFKGHLPTVLELTNVTLKSNFSHGAMAIDALVLLLYQASEF